MSTSPTILANQQALVTLVDTDSFQVPAALARGSALRCPVGTPGFTPPELQNVRFGLVDRTVEHDRFGLGVLIFKLLMEGTHPFDGVYQKHGEPPRCELRIDEGHFAYKGASAVPYLPKPLAPPFELLHPQLRQLMLRCFVDGHENPAA